MAKVYVAGLAPGIVCAPGYTVRITAIHPTTGATVSGVVVSDASLQVDTDVGESTGTKIQLQPPALVHEAGI
jgi:hypothetical protein